MVNRPFPKNAAGTNCTTLWFRVYNKVARSAGSSVAEMTK